MPPRKVATLGDYNKDEPHDSDSEDGVTNTDYFVGGGKNSGLVVQQPDVSDERRPGEDEANIESMLSKIKEKAQSGSTGGSSEATAFRGQGFRLNAGLRDEQTSTAASGSRNSTFGDFLSSFLPSSSVMPSSHSQAANVDADALPVADRLLTIWSDGFSLGSLPHVDDISSAEDVVFYSYSVPENVELLKSIMNGVAPLRLLKVAFGQRVELRILDKKPQAFSTQKSGKQASKMRPFQGDGVRLGSYTGLEPLSTTTGSEPGSAIVALECEASQPQTQLQIRLASGKRLAAKFQRNHTIADVKRFIELNSSGTDNYVLQTGFPPKALVAKDQESIEEAGLLNSTLIQKLL